MAARVLIRNATIISVDPKIGDLHRGEILIEDSRIAAIAPAIAADDAEVIDASNMIAIPGFIDTHRHTWESLLRATGPDWSLAQYFTGVRVVMGGLYTPEDNYVANLLGALDALDSGITTLYDWSHNNNSPEHADASVRGLKDSGIRGVFGYGNANAEWFPPNTIPTNYDDIRRVRKQHFPSDDGLVTMAVASRGPQFTTLDITEKDFLTARELGIRITVHVGDGLWGMSRPLVQLNSRGLLKDDTTYVHCNTIGDDEFKLIGDTGGTGSIAPEVEMQMGHGLPPALRFLAAGIRPSISIDVVTTIPSDMFNAMRALLSGTRLMAHRAALEKKTAVDPLPLTSRDVLEFATLQGARACGLDHKTGSLTPGKEADIVLITTDRMNLIPMNNPVGAVAEFANVGNVDSIFVGGKARKRRGKLLDIDFPAFRKKVDQHRDALFARAGVPIDGSWIVTPYSEEPKVEF
jgi:5-methylthioadenosine/S-adenosylhomocysteine deaminase